MSDPLRTDPSRTTGVRSSASDQDAKIEQLLLDGLDRYFAGRYEEAINVWSRALFLDRAHARARAYIERARGALAEQQRESEELLQTGVAAFNRGDAHEARRLLHEAIDRGAPSDQALAVLGKLDRIEQGTPRQRPARVPAARRHPPPRPARTATRGSRAGGVLAAVAALAVFGSLMVASRGLEWRPPFALEPPPSVAAPVTVESELPLPRRGELALTRARALARGGRLRDALAALDRVRPTDPEKPAADRLRGEIQRQLIAAGGSLPRAASGRPAGDHPVP
jgi:tetratricopeptide (TPR) repeat protein